MTEWVTSHTISTDIGRKHSDLSEITYIDAVKYHYTKYGLLVDEKKQQQMNFLLEHHLGFKMDALLYAGSVLAYLAKVELSDTKAVEYKLKFG